MKNEGINIQKSRWKPLKCKYCKKREFSLEKGIICSLSGDKVINGCTDNFEPIKNIYKEYISDINKFYISLSDKNIKYYKLNKKYSKKFIKKYPLGKTEYRFKTCKFDYYSSIIIVSIAFMSLFFYALFSEHYQSMGYLFIMLMFLIISFVIFKSKYGKFNNYRFKINDNFIAVKEKKIERKKTYGSFLCNNDLGSNEGDTELFVIFEDNGSFFELIIDLNLICPSISVVKFLMYNFTHNKYALN